MILSDVKTLLGIDLTDTTKDAILEIYKRRAIKFIQIYLNDSSLLDTDIETMYEDAVIEMIVHLNSSSNNKAKEGIKSYTEGGMSVTYFDSGQQSSSDIPSTVKSLLPTPRIKVGGY